MTAETAGDLQRSPESSPPEHTVRSGRQIRVIAIVALVAAIVWLGGLGSAIAIVLAVIGLRARPAQLLDRRILQVALALGILGLLVTAVSFGMLASSTSTNT